MTTTASGAETVEWDLSTLFAGPEDPALEAALDQAERRAGALAQRLRGRVADLDGAGLAETLRELGAIEDLVSRAAGYAELRHAQDTTDESRGALVARMTERATAIGQQLLFFELEWAALEDDAVTAMLDGAPLAAAERHHLESSRRYRPHLLTEPEERILADKRQTGRAAFLRLHEEILGGLRVPLAEGHASLEEALSRMLSPDRERRRAAAEGVSSAMAGQLRTLTLIFNTLLHDKAVDDRLRGYDHWLASRNLANEASDGSVAALIDAVVSRYDIPHRYYALKRRLLGGELYDYDRSAALPSAETAPVGFDEARALVLTAYESFSPDLAAIARGFFEGDFVDAPPRPGKRGGAFAASISADVHPFVFLNYTATRRDVMTMAHELGHGVHMVLSNGQGHFGMHTPLTVAETASVFGETVTFGHLLAGTTDPRERLSLLCGRVEDAIATVFRQIAMNRFEDGVHTTRREGGELSSDAINAIWLATQRDMLGPAVTVTDGYATWWSYVPHFVQTPGYVYAYAFGNLFALAVYGRYEQGGAEFVPRYLEMLSAGGSVPPEELGRIVGVDLADPGFWSGGLETIARAVDEAESLADSLGV